MRADGLSHLTFFASSDYRAAVLCIYAGIGFALTELVKVVRFGMTSTHLAADASHSDARPCINLRRQLLLADLGTPLVKFVAYMRAGAFEAVALESLRFCWVVSALVTHLSIHYYFTT